MTMDPAMVSSPAFDAAHVVLERHHLVEASAGTGKTYSLASIYERLIDEKGLSVDRVLVVTFTRAATAELRGRLRERLRQRLITREAEGNATHAEHLRRELRRFDLASVYTIHGFCQRVLLEHGFETGVPFSPSFVEADSALRQAISGDLFAQAFYETHPYVAAAAHYHRVDPAQVAWFVRQAAQTPDLPVVAESRGDMHAHLWLPPEPAPDMREASEHFDATVRSIDLTADDKEAIAAVLRHALEHGWLNGKTMKQAKVERLIRTLRLMEPSPSPLDILALHPIRSDGLVAFTNNAFRDTVRARTRAPATAEAFRKFDAIVEAGHALFLLGQRGLSALQEDLWQRANVELTRRPASLSMLTFRELITRLRDVLEGDGGKPLTAALQRRFDAALVDEFQDTDPAQTAIFNGVFGARAKDTPVFYVGDPKQAIYGFRGADLEAYLRQRRRGGLTRHGLRTNYRSSASLLRGLDTLYTQSPHAFGWTSEVAFERVEPSPTAQELLTNRAPVDIVWVTAADGVKRDGRSKTAERLLRGEGSGLTQIVAADIVALLRGEARLDGQPLRPGQVAVLVRKNREGAAMQRALRDLGVPSVLYGAARVIDSQEAVELAILLDALAAPSNRRMLMQAFATTLVGLDGDALSAMAENEAEWERWAAHFTLAHQTWLMHGFGTAMNGLLDAVAAHENLLRQADGERRLTNLRHLLELLERLSRADSLGPVALVRRFTALRLDDDAGDLGSEELEQRLERDAEGVQIMTIHKSKGLEFDVVYAPFLSHMQCESKAPAKPFTFHDPEDDGRLKVHLGVFTKEAPLHGVYAEETYQEAARLVYVALTRAKQHLVVHTGYFNGYESGPLAHLLFGSEAEKTFSDAAADIKAMKPQDFWTRLHKLAADSEGGVGVRSPVREVEDYELDEGEPRELAARESQRRLPGGFRRTSYSRMIRDAKPHRTAADPAAAEDVTRAVASDGAELDACDVDQEADFVPRMDDAEEPSEAPEEVPSDMPRDDVLPPELGASPSATSASGAIALTRAVLESGPDMGTCLHSILEHADFQHTEGLAELLTDEFSRAALTMPEPAVVMAAFQSILASPLDASSPALSLAALSRADRADEMHFEIPLAHGSAVSARALADCFRRHGAPAASPDYANALRALAFPALRGYLSGDIDLVFRHSGADGASRFYIVDYKSNHLGGSLEHYAPERLPAVMVHHDYFLQYHLYAVAVHRHLRRVVPDYDYDTHFGGAYYLFLRGMAPRAGDPVAGHGVFHDRPTRALVEDLSLLLDQGAAAGRLAGTTSAKEPSR